MATAGLALNVTAAVERVPDPLLENLPPRFWQDTHMAQAFYLFGEFPATANQIVRWRDESGVVRNRELHRHLAVTLEEAGIRPWQFWRVVRENRFRRPAERTLVARYDDSGRPILLGLAFRLRRGIAPFLFFWLAPLMALPVMAWAAAELTRAGSPVAAVVLLLLFGLWPFLADALALSYSPAGFNVLSLLATIPLAAHAALAAAPTRRGLLARAAATGFVLAACALARGGAVLTAGGVLLALAAGVMRIEAGRGRASRLATLAAGCVLLALPYLAARGAVGGLVRRTAAAYGQTSVPPQRHAFWFGMWTGLGDFDRTRGYSWLDADASAAAVAAGGDAPAIVRLRPGERADLPAPRPRRHRKGPSLVRGHPGPPPGGHGVRAQALALAALERALAWPSPRIRAKGQSTPTTRSAHACPTASASAAARSSCRSLSSSAPPLPFWPWPSVGGSGGRVRSRSSPPWPWPRCPFPSSSRPRARSRPKRS